VRIGAYSEASDHHHPATSLGPRCAATRPFAIFFQKTESDRVVASLFYWKDLDGISAVLVLVAGK